MTREDIIRMAREAGKVRPGVEYMPLEVFERFAKLVAEAEREACARLCDAEANRVRDLHDRLDDGCIDALLGKELSARSLAFAIRERGAP